MQDSELLARDSPLSVAESGCQKPNSIPKLRDFKYQLREQSITEADHFSNCTKWLFQEQNSIPQRIHQVNSIPICY